jgi:hypothetical protein
METFLAKQLRARCLKVLWGNGFPPFQQQDRSTPIGQFSREGGTAGTTADHDDVVVAILNDHG